MNLLFIACFCKAQSDSIITEENTEVNPFEPKKIDFTLTLLELTDSLFFENLNNVIISDLDKMYNLCPTNQWKMVYIDIKYMNDSTYIIYAEESDKPIEECDGFIKYNGYTYFIEGDIKAFFIPTKKKKKFSYLKYIYVYDPPIWELKYNIRNKKTELIKKDFL